MKKIVTLLLAVLLTTNIGNLFQKPYIYMNMTQGYQYAQDYAFIAYQYDLMEIYVSDSSHPDEMINVGNYGLEDLRSYGYFNPLHLSETLFRKEATLTLTIDKEKKGIIVVINNPYSTPSSVGIEMNDIMDIDFNHYEVSFIVDKEQNKVKLANLSSSDDHREFGVYIIFK